MLRQDLSPEDFSPEELDEFKESLLSAYATPLQLERITNENGVLISIVLIKADQAFFDRLSPLKIYYLIGCNEKIACLGLANDHCRLRLRKEHLVKLAEKYEAVLKTIATHEDLVHKLNGKNYKDLQAHYGAEKFAAIINPAIQIKMDAYDSLFETHQAAAVPFATLMNRAGIVENELFAVAVGNEAFAKLIFKQNDWNNYFHWTQIEDLAVKYEACAIEFLNKIKINCNFTKDIVAFIPRLAIAHQVVCEMIFENPIWHDYLNGDHLWVLNKKYGDYFFDKKLPFSLLSVFNAFKKLDKMTLTTFSMDLFRKYFHDAKLTALPLIPLFENNPKVMLMFCEDGEFFTHLCHWLPRWWLGEKCEEVALKILTDDHLSILNLENNKKIYQMAISHESACKVVLQRPQLSRLLRGNDFFKLFNRYHASYDICNLIMLNEAYFKLLHDYIKSTLALSRLSNLPVSNEIALVLNKIKAWFKVELLKDDYLLAALRFSEFLESIYQEVTGEDPNEINVEEDIDAFDLSTFPITTVENKSKIYRGLGQYCLTMNRLLLAFDFFSLVHDLDAEELLTIGNVALGMNASVKNLTPDILIKHLLYALPWFLKAANLNDEHAIAVGARLIEQFLSYEPELENALIQLILSNDVIIAHLSEVNFYYLYKKGSRFLTEKHFSDKMLLGRNDANEFYQLGWQVAIKKQKMTDVVYACWNKAAKENHPVALKLSCTLPSLALLHFQDQHDEALLNSLMLDIKYHTDTFHHTLQAFLVPTFTQIPGLFKGILLRGLEKMILTCLIKDKWVEAGVVEFLLGRIHAANKNFGQAESWFLRATSFGREHPVAKIAHSLVVNINRLQSNKDLNNKIANLMKQTKDVEQFTADIKNFQTTLSSTTNWSPGVFSRDNTVQQASASSTQWISSTLTPTTRRT